MRELATPTSPPPTPSPPSSLVTNAALYAAKQGGRNRVTAATAPSSGAGMTPSPSG